MQAVILAGGLGTRLYPLTLHTPKAMVKVNGRPFVMYIIDALKKYGINDIVFCVGHLSGQFKAYFGDGSGHGISIKYSVEKEFMGTAGALKLAKRYLKSNFFVINGDTYLPIDYAAAHKVFLRARTTAMAVIYDNMLKIAAPNIAIDDKGMVTAYVKKEKLKQGSDPVPLNKGSSKACRFIDAGVQVFNKKALALIPDGSFVSLEVDIFPQLIARKELVSYVVAERYYDIGTRARLKTFMHALEQS